MNLAELLSEYHGDKRVSVLANGISVSKRLFSIEQAVGSQLSFWANSVTEGTSNTHVFILEDKEQAAYFLNDLQAFNERPGVLHFFPAPMRSPYEADHDNDGERITRNSVLDALTRRPQSQLIVTYPEALLPMVAATTAIEESSLILQQGEEMSLELLMDWLEEQGFEQVEMVFQPGQFSVRGGIIDIFSYGNAQPNRMELFGDTINSVRSFDPADQLTTTHLGRAIVLPDLEFKMQSDQRGFIDRLPEHTVIWIRDPEGLEDRITKPLEIFKKEYERLSDKTAHRNPQELFTEFSAVQAALKAHTQVIVGRQAGAVSISLNGKPQPSFNKNFELLSKHLNDLAKQGFRNVIACSNPKQVERLYTIFEDIGKEVEFTPLNLKIQEGFIDNDLKVAVFTDHQIFERYQRYRLKEGFKKNSQALTLRELTQLKPGDLVVHVDHGIGKFSGLEKLEVEGGHQEAIRLLYRDNDILYVSIHSLHRVSKYSAKEGVAPKVNKLGTSTWKNLKERTKSRVKRVAFDLIKLYAKRKAQAGHAYPPDNYLQHELEASFIYEDTPDQEKSTEAVKADMEKPTPMDRLVCGDVGFGKTEIAIRAAFKAVCDSKQVAVMVPTTILSFQHYKTFSARLKDLPCRVDYINRFRSSKEITQILKDLKEGKIDILIGTHRIASKDVVFKDLGLLVLDEEQKFGVGVKDKLKTLRASVDTLTLTATPIPRTLQFSLLGARDLSIISTPPPNRYPVKTIVTQWNEEVIREAIENEVARGGQVFLVNDKVQNIHEVAGLISRMCPGISICVGHGQMDGKQLEKVMLEFIEGQHDVLIATTIIESGLDIPNANTMIVNNAHQFGLSDLHQLRGRVGRSNKRAYCYLLAPPTHMLSPVAKRRLTAIEQFNDLGSGLHIAMKDLDIRGAGDLLGAEQSGFINDIGMETYQRILDEAVQELKENEFKELFKDDPNAHRETVRECQIDTDLELLIPQDYVHDIAERLSLYRELDELSTSSEINAYADRLLDRFGPIPQQTEELLKSMHVRIWAKKHGIEKLLLRKHKLVLHFVTDTESPFYKSDSFMELIEFMKHAPAGYTMYEKAGGLRVSIKNVERVDDVIHVLKQMMGSKVIEKEVIE